MPRFVLHLGALSILIEVLSSPDNTVTGMWNLSSPSRSHIRGNVMLFTVASAPT
jgi:hypothetical protein